VSGGKTVVFTNGAMTCCIRGTCVLERARELGDVLVLALNTDASVQRLKGPSRPLIPENDGRSWPRRSRRSTRWRSSTRIRRAN